MWHLMKSELLRFRGLAIGFAIAHLLLLRAVVQWGELFAPEMAKLAGSFLLYSLAGLALGLYQFGTYKKLDRWTYLIHRPLPPARILLALGGAAALLLLAVFVLPLALVTLYADVLTSQWVDLRHYLMAPFLFGNLLSFYLAGAFIALSASRAAVLVLVLPSFFLTRSAEGWWIFLPQLLIVLWLAYLVYAAFKPDLSTHLRRPMAVAASALPLQYSFLWLLFVLGSLTYSTTVAFQEHGWRSYAAHAWNDYFPEGTIEFVGYRDEAGALAHGLRHVESERGRHLTKQIELAELYEIQPLFLKSPTPGQPMFMDREDALRDGEQEIRWLFSHDRMLFHGRNMRTGAFVGWLGPQGPLDPTSDHQGLDQEAQRFAEIPFTIANRWLVTQHRLYEFDAQRQSLRLRFEITGDERLTTPLEIHGTFATVLSDQALYFFDPRDLDQEAGRVEPVAAVPLAGKVKNLSRINIAELIDGYLLSFVFGDPSQRGFHDARQVVAELGVDGRYEVVAEEPLTLGQPEIVVHQGFIASPVLQTLHDLAWSAIAPERPNRVALEDLLRRSLSPRIWAWALGVAVCSALLTSFAAQRRRLQAGQRWAWTAAAFFFGLPAFLSFLFLTSASEHFVRRTEPSKGAPVMDELVGSPGLVA